MDRGHGLWSVSVTAWPTSRVAVHGVSVCSGEAQSHVMQQEPTVVWPQCPLYRGSNHSAHTPKCCHSYLVEPPDTHRAHRWGHSIPTDSGTQSQTALHGKSPRWHTGWRHRRAQLQNQNMSGTMPTELKHPSPSPPDPEFTGVQGSEKRAQSGSLRDSIPTYPARSSCPSSRLGRRRGIGQAQH